MTFNPAVPLPSDSPGIFPAQNQGNMTVLQTIISKDHQFNNTPMGGDNSGYHNLIHLTPQAPAGALPAIGRFYGKAAGARIQSFYMDDAGNESQISPTLPIFAAVSFTAVSNTIVILKSFNVASVTGSNGNYRINYGPNAQVPAAPNYIVLATAGGLAENIAAMIAQGTAATTMTNTFVDIRTWPRTGGGGIIPAVCNVVCLGAI